MADEVRYASGPDSATNKRKYGDRTPPPPSSGTRWATGFSAPIASQSRDSGHAPSSYNSVPPYPFHMTRTIYGKGRPPMSRDSGHAPSSYNSVPPCPFPMPRTMKRTIHRKGCPPMVVQSPEWSYNSVPPPLDDFQIEIERRRCREPGTSTSKKIKMEADPNLSGNSSFHGSSVPAGNGGMASGFIGSFVPLELKDNPNDIRDDSLYSGKAIELYNDKHGTNYKFVKIKEAYFVPVARRFFFITFEATDDDKDGGQCKTFNAGILHGALSEPEIKFCDLEPITFGNKSMASGHGSSVPARLTYIYEGGVCTKVIKENGEVLLWDDMFEKTPFTEQMLFETGWGKTPFNPNHIFGSF